jgi:excisionase family DNA binding protein
MSNPVQLQIGVTINETTKQAIGELLGPIIESAFVKWARRQADVVKDESPVPKVAGKRDPVEASRHALFGRQTPPEDLGLLLDNRELAQLLKLSPRTIWRMQNEGEMPAPLPIGRAVRFSYDEIKA